jgi:pimeloyl-ACP methyl ester carboxylesterase
MNSPQFFFRVRHLLLALVTLGLASCSIAPASLQKLMPKFGAETSSDAELHRLLTRAVVTPSTPDSAQALGLFIEGWKKRGPGANQILPAITPGGPAYHIKFPVGEEGCYPLSYFDELHSALDLKVGKIAHYRRDGVGAPLVALRENRHQQPIEKFYPPEAITRPLTAVASAGPIKQGIQDVEIRLLCPLVNPTVSKGGGKEPLAADYSAPWAALLARTGKPHQDGFLNVLTTAPKQSTQLYLMEAYDPKKEPLIMIHGLFSTPLVWFSVSNEMWADESIRRRYQIWHYKYNTSAPPLYSARLLRAQLRELRQLLDQRGKDPASKHTSLLTHSMGGIVAKAITSEPRDAFWKAAFKVPPETLKLSPEDRSALQDAFEWEPERTVRRIIFVAVPHRGSDFADNVIGRLGQWLTAPPQPFKAFYNRISATNPDVFTDDYRALANGELDSINVLSPRQPTLRILSALPFAYPLHTHSIIANRGRSGLLEKSSDGVVPYESSHLEGAHSELIVPSDHWACRHPATIAEIKRCLRLP